MAAEAEEADHRCLADFAQAGVERAGSRAGTVAPSLADRVTSGKLLLFSKPSFLNYPS